VRAKVAIIVLLGCSPLKGQFADADHPRLWMRTQDEAVIRQRIASDPLAARLQEATIREADRILQEPTCRYDIPDGRRLLRQSRYALNNILHSAWAWRLTGERKYLERTVAELTAASQLKDWNPSHFLDTAEMALAVAVGYDWAYPELTADQRAMCEKAIRDKALKPAKLLYDDRVWWDEARNNWGQVCGSGIALAAIAIEGRDEGLSGDLIRRGLDLVRRCEHFYVPDGLYPEGPGYWHYGTNYHVMLLAACETLKHPVSIPALLEQSGNSMVHLYSPGRLPFNFADGHARASSISPAQAWIAGHFRNAAQSSDARTVLARALDPDDKLVKHLSSPLTLLWLPQAVDNTEALPLHAAFRGEQAAAVFRSSWQSDAAWLAIKGGTPEGGHGHMDVGSFCYDAHGVRWIHDLGSDDYNMPGYFRDQRFSYYRLQNRSHNTLEINGELQDPDCAPCPLTAFTNGDQPSATFNLTAAYSHSADKVIRSVDFEPASGVAVLRDEVTKPRGEVVWRVITDAGCTIEGDKVVLRKNGKTIELRRLSRQGTWSVTDATPPLGIENPNKGYRSINLSVPAGDRLTIEVEIRP